MGFSGSPRGYARRLRSRNRPRSAKLEGGNMSVNNSDSDRRTGGWSWWYLLFLIQFVLALWPPFYNSIEPSFIGMPFFYWSQLALVLLGAVMTAIVYFATED
jgi:hypothetical protein